MKPFIAQRLTMAALAGLCLTATTFAHAQIGGTTIGATNSGNSFPFSPTYVGEYQQVYASSAFASPLTIGELDFASQPGAAIGYATENLTIGLGTTATTPANPAANYAANKNPDFTTVWSGSEQVYYMANGTYDTIFKLTTPFNYNPANGNLLLDIVNNGSTGTDTQFLSGNDPNTGRVYNYYGNGAVTSQGGYGLETRFSPASSVTVASTPEPGAWAMFASAGMIGLGVLRRRRR